MLSFPLSSFFSTSGEMLDKCSSTKPNKAELLIYLETRSHFISKAGPEFIVQPNLSSGS